MKALQFNVTTGRFVVAKILGGIFGSRVFYAGPAKTLQLADIAEPALPSPDWAKIQTRYCGFCGSDLNLIRLHDSPTASPFTSFPCVMGHEITGRITETGLHVRELTPGDRVVMVPALGCETRGISPLCPSCRAGRTSNCENFAEGSLPPGMFTGINRAINGGFAPLVVAHKSQMFRVPDGVSDMAAVMTEPAAVALQAVFENPGRPGENVLVVGGGVIGNLIVQALRVLTPDCRISVIEPSDFAASLARDMGADEVIAPGRVTDRISRITGARRYKPMLGPEILMGGFARIFDTVASNATLNMSLRALAAMGTLSMVGIGANIKIDPTPLWLKLQTVQGAYGYGMVTHQGERRHVFAIALELMHNGKIRADPLVTHRFAIENFREMIAVNLDKARHRAMKTVVSFADANAGQSP